MKAIQIKIDEKTDQRLDKVCDRAGESKDEFVSHLISNYLDKSDAATVESRMRETSFSSLSEVMDEHIGRLIS